MSHDDRALRAARAALRHHEEEARLEGFEGRAEGKVPEAWRLLHRTIKDAMKDRSEERRVESSLSDVEALRASEETAKRKYKEEKQQLKRDAGAGEVGEIMAVTDRSGGLRAEESGIEHIQKHLEKKERSWVRAESLEDANLAAAKELRMEHDLDDAFSPPPSPAAAAPAVPVAHADEVKKVHFIPKHFFALPSVPKGGVLPRKHGARVVKQQQQLVPVGALPEALPDGELKGRIDLRGAKVPMANDVAMFRQSESVGHRRQVQRDGGDEQKRLLRAEGKSSMPDVPNDITNSIVQRLLNMAHKGQLKVGQFMARGGGVSGGCSLTMHLCLLPVGS